MFKLYMVLVIAWAFFAAGISASFNSDLWPQLSCAGAGFALTVAWILLTALPSRRMRHGSEQGERAKGSVLIYAVTWPVAVATVVVLSWSSTPLAIRVLLSQESLQEVVADSDKRSISRSAGLFEVDGTDTLNGCTFIVLGKGMEGPDGLVFVPAGVEPPTRYPTGQGARFRHVTGNWWRFATFT